MRHPEKKGCIKLGFGVWNGVICLPIKSKLKTGYFMKPLRWRLFLVTVLTLWSIYAVTPTILYFMQDQETQNDTEKFAQSIPSWLPKSHVKLGLDLRGGVNLVLGVNTHDAIENRLGRTGIDVKRWSEDKKIGVSSSYVEKGTGKLTVVLADDADQGKFKEAFKSEFSDLSQLSNNGSTFQYGYKESELDRIKKSALEQAERVIRNRIDQWGVTEPMINRRVDGSILVQLPGFRDPQKAKELLGRTAQLQFKIVDDQFNGFAKIDTSTLPAGITVGNNNGQLAFVGEDRDALVKFLSSHVPADHELLFNRQQLGDGSQGRYRWTSYVVFAEAALSGDDIADAHLAQGGGLDRSPVVAIKFTGPGGRQFAKVTGENVKKRMAIVLDGVIESDPVINERIAGGNATISLGGGRSYNEKVDEGTQLAMILKSGAIPATISVLEERQVGATLGPELASQGIKGILVGLGLVLLFMILYYHRPGVIACIALVLNAIFLLAIMAGFGFALSLPGIAGFVLTLGMAVDANVLINARIRQELREGKHPRKSVDVAFNRVFSTIIDSHVTTLLAGFVLLETNGSGPIRGFAITLIVGLLVSLYTSLYCTRLFFDMAMSRVADKNLKAWLGGDNKPATPTHMFNFLGAGKYCVFAAVALSIAVVSTGVIRGVNFGVDFAGGTEMHLRFNEDVEADAINKVAEKSKLEGVSLQALNGGKKEYLLRFDQAKADTPEEQSAHSSENINHFKQELATDLGDKGAEILQADYVGPQIGKELRLAGILSVLYAILAVILYIAFRFDLRFSPGAMVKMFLDVFIMLGFYVFLGVSFDLVAVAAFLTVVGYSVNDTIVIFDRIRENLHNHPRRTLWDNINMSINETLSRSINTSMTIVLSLVGILILGTGQIWNFAMAMTIGVVVATISSIFIAPTFVLWFEYWKKPAARQVNSIS
jgi:protein-export membrane protein SecD/preprotein translocase SecF subunit